MKISCIRFLKLISLDITGKQVVDQYNTAKTELNEMESGVQNISEKLNKFIVFLHHTTGHQVQNQDIRAAVWPDV